MLKQAEVDAEEDRLRNLASSLADEQRSAFYRDLKRELKDPDTYAVLNWFFLTGLHHFYLGRWLPGAIDLGLFLVGIVLIINGEILMGFGLVLLVTLWELWALFRAQIIVQHWNNKLYSGLLTRYGVNLGESRRST